MTIQQQSDSTWSAPCNDHLCHVWFQSIRIGSLEKDFYMNSPYIGSCHGTVVCKRDIKTNRKNQLHQIYLLKSMHYIQTITNKARDNMILTSKMFSLFVYSLVQNPNTNDNTQLRYQSKHVQHVI